MSFIEYKCTVLCVYFQSVMYFAIQKKIPFFADSALDNMSPALGGGVGGGILGVLVLLFIVCICLYAYILYRRKRQATAGYQQAQEVSSQTYTESPGNILVQETSNNQPRPIMLLQPNNAPSVSTYIVLHSISIHPASSRYKLSTATVHFSKGQLS